MPIGNISTKEEEIRQSRPMPEHTPEQNNAPTGPTMAQKLMASAKNKVLSFHYSMMARKRANAEMKRKNPKRYTKMVQQRKKRYDVMKTPSLFDGSQGGRMKW